MSWFGVSQQVERYNGDKGINYPGADSPSTAKGILLQQPFFFFFSDVLNTLVVGKSVAVRRTEGPRWGVCALVSEGDHRRARDDDLRQSTSQPAVRMHMIDRQLSDTTSEQTASKAASAFSVIS